MRARSLECQGAASRAMVPQRGGRGVRARPLPGSGSRLPRGLQGSAAAAAASGRTGRAPAGQGCAGLCRASSEPPCGRRARLLWMGARALGVGALFVNVLLVLAPDGSRSNAPPSTPSGSCSSPPVSAQQRRGAQTPSRPGSDCVRLSGNPSGAKRWLLFIYSF